MEIKTRIIPTLNSQKILRIIFRGFEYPFVLTEMKVLKDINFEYQCSESLTIDANGKVGNIKRYNRFICSWVKENLSDTSNLQE